MDWTIHPNLGLGPLRFGMTPEQVLAAAPGLGAPQQVDREWDGSVREARGVALPSIGYAEGRVLDIDCSAHVAGVTFEGMDVFAVEPARLLRRLFELNGGALAGLGSVLFLKLGINTGGFFDAEAGRFAMPDPTARSYRTLAVFAPGAFDDLAGEMAPITFPA